MYKILSIAVLIVIILSGCTQKSSQKESAPSGVNSSQKEPTSSADASLFQRLTIKEAQEKVPFKILIPSHLPNETVFQYAQVYDGAEFISEGKGKSVSLTFGNGTEGFSVQEQIGVMGQLNSGDVKKVTVNNTEAQFSNDKKGFNLTLLWKVGNIVCLIFTNPGSSFANEKGLNDIASSFK